MRQRPIQTVSDAVAALRDRIVPVDAETVAAEASIGRALAQDVVLDRPSPPTDVSAMDGYAMRAPVAGGSTLRVLGEARAGRPAPLLPPDADAAIRIFTGAPVPQGATTVVQREQLDERVETVTLRNGAQAPEGANIRRKGENGKPGDIVCSAGRAVGPAVLSALASCGMASVLVRRRLRVGVLVTGDEVLAPDTRPEDWSLRDSNGPTLMAMFARRPWIARVEHRRVGDEPRAIADSVTSLLASNDALIITGGVSAGDYDHVPRVLADLGVETIFHKLAIRPGKPVLGGVDRSGLPVLGLPGNPVATMVTGVLLALPALLARAGMDHLPHGSFVEVRGEVCGPPSLTWFPPVRLEPDGRAVLVAGRGSGDWVAAARSDGFIEVPPGQAARGTRRYVPWSV